MNRCHGNLSFVTALALWMWPKPDRKWDETISRSAMFGAIDLHINVHENVAEIAEGSKATPLS